MFDRLFQHPRRWALWILGVTLLTACGGVPLNIRNRVIREVEVLPGTPEGLVKEAERIYSELGPAGNIERGLIAATQAIYLDTKNTEAWIWAAKTCGWLWDYGGQAYGIDPLSGEVIELDCGDIGRAALRRDPKNPEVRYAVALILGQKLQRASIAGAPFAIKPFMIVLKPLVKDAPDLDSGGPLRVLGALYLKAPPWPTGPGDLDLALELLERAATDHPNHPLNHLFYAEALMEDDELELAQEHLKLARKRLDVRVFGWRTERYERMIYEVEVRLRDDF